MPYEVSTPVFEGPFDLLLHLIVRDQVDLYDVPLVRIVDAYLAELERLELASFDLDVATEFLLIAATLVELKTRRLLPGSDDDPTLDDELQRFEERDLLLARLLECKTFKDAAAVLAERRDDAARSFPRTAGPDERFIALTPDPLAGVSPDALRAAFLKAVTAQPPAPVLDLRHITAVRASVTDAVAELLEELPRVGRLSFRAITAGLGERLEVVVRFLAILELYKDGLVDLDQREARGDIDVRWTGRDDADRVPLVLTADES